MKTVVVTRHAPLDEPGTSTQPVPARTPHVFRRTLATCKKCGFGWTVVPSVAKKTNLTDTLARAYEMDHGHAKDETPAQAREYEESRRDRLAAAAQLRSTPSLWLYDFECCGSNLQVVQVGGRSLTEAEVTAEFVKRGLK
ncbi:MAG: hypothetical protein A2Y75_01540 [Candidatus Solincola sediminis]|uniref:Uncharacterized protein n=1 Tax=Candidatus Solincola sediminis TaxID=1797199 RepID=A0A1F2WNJ0_9ACTN|nr:MAG: hypothetical protein A2Y75_01540 [Candidatus Solincola sediminis]